jgi:hypothetical protein
MTGESDMRDVTRRGRPAFAARGAVLLAIAIPAAWTARPARAADPLARFESPPPDERYQALPRPLEYGTPLTSTAGPQAAIVYGETVDWTRSAAVEVQQAVREWCGAELPVVSDRTVTSEETWLLSDEYRHTPLIVLGNCRDNRVLHALGTRYLACSNYMWPGGDRYLVRTAFEPFVAGVNFICLEASTEAGLEGAVGRLRELLTGVTPDAQATVPHTIIAGGTHDTWAPTAANQWSPQPDYANLDGSVSEIAAATKGKPFPGGLVATAMAAAMGGYFSDKPPSLSPGMGAARAIAAKIMNDSREWGGRTHRPFDHYSAMVNIIALRLILSCAVLTPEEFTEAENWMVLSAADPHEYYYDEIGAYDHRMNHEGGRHFASCLLITVTLTDYVLNHCRLTDDARQEVARRAEGAYKTTAVYVNSFRDNLDTWELAESTMMVTYAMLHQGLPQIVTGGNLRRAADMSVMTNDNLPSADYWRQPMCYAGLDNYIGSAPGCLRIYWHGRGLLAAAAFYYDDPEYRWFLTQLPYGSGPWGSVATPLLPMHYDATGESRTPTRYDGVIAMPFDPRLYDVVAHPESGGGWGRRFDVRLPGPLEQAADRVAFRDGMSPQDAYLFLATSQRLHDMLVGQNNALARYTDLGDVWLFHNTMLSTCWARNVVSISNGKPFVPATGCLIDALANLGDVSLAGSREHDVSGTDWTRTVVHWRGHYFVVLDRIQALAADQFNLVCRWRSPQPARLEGPAWVATAADGDRLRLQPGEALPQTSEHRGIDGTARPYVLSQFKSLTLAEGAAATFQNLLYVSGEARPDEFALRQLSPTAAMVSGRTEAGPHLALVGTGGSPPLAELETDAAVYHITAGHLLLAEATTLRVREGQSARVVLSASRPVNVRLDPATGEAEVEVRGQESATVAWGSATQADVRVPPGKTSLGLLDPRRFRTVPAALARLWAATKPVASPKPSRLVGGKPAVSALGEEGLRRPCRRIERVKFMANPPTGQPVEFLSDDQYRAWLAGYYPTWRQADGVDLTVDLGEPMAVSHLRLVSTMQPARGNGLYRDGDLKFALVLSDDNFGQDVRRMDQPQVTFDETGIYPIFHHDFGRLPTFRLEVGATARYIRIVPASVNPEKPFVSFQGCEVYGPEPADDLVVRTFAADLNGDGGNELVVGTSNREIAAFGADGERLWSFRLPGDLFTMGCADLDDDGRSEVLAETMREALHCLNGDGTERYRADLNQALRKVMGDEHVESNTAAAGALALGVWAPEGPQRKVVVLPSEISYRVTSDGEAEPCWFYQDWGWRGATRLTNLWPGEPEVLATVGTYITLFSPKRDADGNYTRLANKQPAGRPGAFLMHGFGWAQQVDLPGYQGLLAANESGVNWCPIDYLTSDAETGGWGFDTGGVPIVAALAEDLTGDGLPEVCLAREDGFVNVLSLATGAPLALLNTGEPILGMGVLGAEAGPSPRRLVVGTRFAVHVYGADFVLVSRTAAPAIGFAGPGGPPRDRVYVVHGDGSVGVPRPDGIKGVGERA